MKNLFAKNITLVAMLLLGATAQAGHVVQNGGDEYSIQFVEIADQVATKLPNMDEAGVVITADKLRRVIAATQVESTDTALSLNGVPKDALNYPELHKIVINRAAWNRITSTSTRFTLVLHEYLGVAGIDDSRYQISTAAIMVTSSGHSYGKCADLPKAQQAVFAPLNVYLSSGNEKDAMMFIGALSQYLANYDENGSATNPNYGNDFSVALWGSTPAYLCTDENTLDRKIRAGDKTAIALMMFYSAISKGDDGYAAEDLGDIQDEARKNYPAVVNSILKQNAAFFKQHPMVWVYDRN